MTAKSPQLRHSLNFAAHPQAAVALAAVVAAALAARELGVGNSRAAALICLLPVIVFAVTRPHTLFIALGAAIPWTQNLAGGSGAGAWVGAYNISPSDIVMVALAIVLLLRLATGEQVGLRIAMKPIWIPIAQYSVLMIALLPFHPVVPSYLLKTGQRYELFLIPIVLGAYAVSNNMQMRVIRSYIFSTSVLGIAFVVGDNFAGFGVGDKNPVGQFIDGAILLIIAFRKHEDVRRLVPLLVVLMPCLLATYSRGSVVALAAGLMVIVVFDARSISTILKPLLAVVLIGALTFFALPAANQNRLTTFTTGSAGTVRNSAEYSLLLRFAMQQEAQIIIDAHPMSGVGVGELASATGAANLPVLPDPHNVFYLQAAEGGYALAVSFGILVLGVAIALWRMRLLRIAVAAAAVLLSSVTHGLADVYWVRGTPVMGWVLVGMACATFAYRQRTAESA